MFGSRGIIVTTTNGNHSHYPHTAQILCNLQYRYQEMAAIKTEAATNVRPAACNCTTLTCIKQPIFTVICKLPYKTASHKFGMTLYKKKIWASWGQEDDQS